MLRNRVTDKERRDARWYATAHRLLPYGIRHSGSVGGHGFL